MRSLAAAAVTTPVTGAATGSDAMRAFQRCCRQRPTSSITAARVANANSASTARVVRRDLTPIA